jgi:AraC-like DNA-binding protein
MPNIDILRGGSRVQLKDIVFVYHLKDERQMAWHGRIHAHGEGEYELHYFVSGSGTFLNANARYNILPGTLHLSLPAKSHQITATDPRDPISYYALLFNLDSDDGDLAAFLAERAFRKAGPLRVGPGWRFFFAELRERLMSGEPDLEKAAAYQFLAFLYGLTPAEGQSAYSGTRDSVHIEKAIALMQNSIEGSLNLQDIADRLEITREHFVRVFTARMHLPPMRYFSKLKIEAAMAMLSSTNFRVGEIADKLGYGSQFHFSRAFARLAGCSPSEYRVRRPRTSEFPGAPPVRLDASGQ